MSELLKAQLYALRAQLDAVIYGVEAMTTPAPQPSGGCPTCGAPEEKQADASTLGGPPLKQCLVCRHEYQG